MIDSDWLPPERIDVWQVRLDPGLHDFPGLFSTLCDDERRRAARFRREVDRTRFILSHGLLRVVLSRYLATEPAQLVFGRGSHGKPVLTGERRLRFNLSHSGDVALFAVARGREIGIDVERIRPDIDWEALAERFFSAWETAALRALPPDDRIRGFFSCWTRKEAYLKARGKGLSASLGSFSVAVAPGATVAPGVAVAPGATVAPGARAVSGGGPALLEVEGRPEEPSRWHLVDLDAGEGYAAALAAEAGSWEVRRFTLPEPGDGPVTR